MTETTATAPSGTPSEYPPLLMKRHLAELLERHIRTIYRLENQGKLPASVNIGRQRVWAREEIMHWIGSGLPQRRVWEKLHPKYRKKSGGN